MAQEALPPVSREVIQKVWKNLNLDEKRVKEAVEDIKEWMKKQPHLPEGEDDGRLERWLMRCKNSMEKTKKTLDMYYTLNTILPEVLCDRDTNQPWFDRLSKHFYEFPMPTLTPELDRVHIFGFFPRDAKDFDYWDFAKMTVMEFDIRMTEDYNMKDIMILDYKNCTLGHISKFTLPGMKKMELFVFKGFASRLRAVHYINTPPYANVMVSMIKSILKPKLAARVHVHGTDLTEFHKLVPKECLPVEFGGIAGTVQEHWGRWQEKLKSYRDWFASREHMKTDESKRPNGKVNSSDLFGFEGSFRKLTVD